MTLLEDPRPTPAHVPIQGTSSGAAQERYFPLWQIVFTRVKEFYRHPSAIFWVYVFPVLMAVVLGIAFQNPNAERYQVDVQQGPGVELLVNALHTAAGSEEPIAITARVVDEAQGRRDLKTARTMLVIVPRAPAGSGRTSALEHVQLDYRYDPTRPESVAARRTVDDVLQRAAGRRDAIAVENSRFEEPGGRYIDFLVPGLLGASLMSGGMWGVGFVVVDLRVRHLLKRFITTPMRKGDFLAGLMLSRFFFMLTEVVVMLAFVRVLFDVRVLGSWGALVLFVVIGSLAFAGLGLLVACRAQTLETASGLINLVMLPMWLVSGIFFSAERFPEIFQPLIRILPLTALIDGVRAIMVEGVGLGSVLSQFIVLLAWTVVSFVIALKVFRWY